MAQPTTLYLKAGDTLPAVTGTLVDQSGNAVNLTGASVYFIMTNAFFGNAVNSPATITNATLGQVSYSWQSGDTNNTGLFDYQWYVVFSGGGQESFPQGYYGKIQIDPQLSSGFEGLLQGNPLFNTIHYSGSAPTATQGSNGDYWYNTATYYFYGPKASGTWPAGFLLNPAGLSLSSFAAPTANVNMGGFGFTNLGTTVSGTFTTLNAGTLNVSGALNLSTLDIAPSSTTAVPLICNIPTSSTADVADFELNGTKTWWITSAGVFNGIAPLSISPTSTAVVPATFNLPTGSSHDIVDFQVNGSTKASVSSAGVVSGQAISASGLTGATTASRIAGATAGGYPTSGTFATGDIVYDTLYACQWLCTSGGTSGTWTLIGTATISKQTLASNASSVTFAIPTYFNNLKITYKTQTTATVQDFVGLQFNSDTTASHYSWQDISIYSTLGAGSPTATGNYATTPTPAALLLGPCSNANFVSGSSVASVEIPFVLDTHFYKELVAYGAMGDAGNNYGLFTFGGTWKSTAAVTSIKLIPATGPNFVTNSVFECLGSG